MKKNFEEPNFEKTEFEAVAYLCRNSNYKNPGDTTPPGNKKPQGGSHKSSHKHSH